MRTSQLAMHMNQDRDLPHLIQVGTDYGGSWTEEIPGAGMIAFLDSSLNDVGMTVYVDLKGCLASVKGTTSFNSTGSEAEPVRAAVGCVWSGRRLSDSGLSSSGGAGKWGCICWMWEGWVGERRAVTGRTTSLVSKLSENQGEIAEKWDITLDSSL